MTIDLVHATGLGVVHFVSCWPQPRLTVVVKGLFHLAEDGVCQRSEDPVVFSADEPMKDAPARLRYASDLAPFKPAADVLLVGEGSNATAKEKPLLRVGAHLFEASIGARNAFAPLSPNAEDRRRHLGTYDERWLKQRWPYFPEDFDARYYSAAPAAMQVEGYLQGGERVILEQLTPSGGSLQTRLPGLRVRGFLIDSNERMTELLLRLDTLWLDASALRAALVWRGIADVSSEEPSEVSAIYLATEPLDEPPQSLDAHQRGFALAVMRRDKVAPTAAIPVRARPPANDAAPLPDDSASLAKITKLLEDAHAPSEVITTVAGAKSLMGLLDSLHTLIDPDPKKAAEAMAMGTKRTKEQLEAAGLDPTILDDLAKKSEEKASHGVEEPRPWTRDRIQAAAAAGETMEGLDLRRRDLSNLDLTGALLCRALLGEANLNGTKLDKADLGDASLVRADLTAASLSAANLENADLTGATASGVDGRGASLKGAVFDEAKCDDALFDDASAEGASFRKADLSRASLQKANLERATLDQATLDDVNATGAVLKDASLYGAHGERVRFCEADLSKARVGRGASFVGVSLRSAQADGSIWAGADLRRANLSSGRFVRADFSRAKCDGATFDGANCESADFTRGSLAGAFLRGANLAGACMDSADLSLADARMANMYEAEVWRANTKGALFEGAHLAMTKLAGRAT